MPGNPHPAELPPGAPDSAIRIDEPYIPSRDRPTAAPRNASGRGGRS